MLIAAQVLFVVFHCTSVGSSSVYAAGNKKFEVALKEFVHEWDDEHDLQKDEPVRVPDSNPSVAAVVDDDSEHYSAQTETDAKVNCSKCGSSRQLRQNRLDSIKVDVLSKLGLKGPPNITVKTIPNIPPLENLLDMYNLPKDAPAENFVPGPQFGEDDEYRITAEKVLALPHAPPERLNVIDHENVLYFKFSSSVMASQVQTAHLWVHIRPSRHAQSRNVSLYQVVRHFTSDQTDLVQIKKKAIEKRNRHGNWIVFDVKKTVTQWFRHPKENLGLVVRFSDSDMNELVMSDIDGTEEEPFIEVKVEKHKHRRNRRMIGLNCEENSTEVRCCRYPLTVDFEEFGWDWIIAPKRYEANYCSGECPYVFLQKYPHTHLVQQANPQGSAGPCCAPRKMSSISMLYFDEDGNIIYGVLPGMVVDRCGCS